MYHMSQPKKRKRYIHVLVIFLSTNNQENSEINTSKQRKILIKHISLHQTSNTTCK